VTLPTHVVEIDPARKAAEAQRALSKKKKPAAEQEPEIKIGPEGEVVPEVSWLRQPEKRARWAERWRAERRPTAEEPAVGPPLVAVPEPLWGGGGGISEPGEGAEQPPVVPTEPDLPTRAREALTEVFPERDVEELVLDLESAYARIAEIASTLEGVVPPFEKQPMEIERAGLEADLDKFFMAIFEYGRTSGTESLLRAMGATREEVEGFFAVAKQAIPEEGSPVEMETVDGEIVHATIFPDFSVSVEGRIVGRFDPSTGDWEEQYVPTSRKEAWERYQVRLVEVANEYEDVADWTRKGWEDRRKQNPERVQAWWDAKNKAWDEYLVEYGLTFGALSFRKLLAPAAEWGERYLGRPWEVLLMEVAARTAQANNAINRALGMEEFGANLDEEIQAVRQMDELYETYGWQAIFADEVHGVWEDFKEVAEEKRGTGGFLTALEWANPVYLIPIGRFFGWGSRLSSRVPVIGKGMERTAAAVQYLELQAGKAIAYPIVKTLRAPGRVLENVGEKLGKKYVQQSVKRSRYLELAIDLPANEELLNGVLVDNWMKRVIINASKVKPVRVGVEKALGWRILVERQGTLIDDIVGRGAVVHAEVMRRGPNVARVKVNELRSLVKDPVKYFGFDDAAFSTSMAKRLRKGETVTPEVGTLEHVFTRPEAYNWKGMDLGLEYVTRVHEVNTQVLNFLKKQGVPPEGVLEDWWIHRVVTGRVDAEGELLALRGRPGRGGFAIGKRASYDFKRKAPTMAEGMAWGVKYSPNIEDSVGTYIQEAYKKVADHRFIDYVATFPEISAVTPAERFVSQFPELAAEVVQTAKLKADAEIFRGHIQKAIEGWRPNKQTLNAIDRRFPQWSAEFRRLIAKPAQVEEELRKLLLQNRRIIDDLQKRLVVAEKVDVRATAERARQEGYRMARQEVPPDFKLREAFEVMDHSDKLAFREAMEGQIVDLDQLFAEQAAELEVLSSFLKDDVLWHHQMMLGRRKVGWAYFFGKKEGLLRETITVKEAQALLGRDTPVGWALDAKGRVKTDVLLPDVVERLEDTLGIKIGTADDFVERLVKANEMENTVADLDLLMGISKERMQAVERMIHILDDVTVKPGQLAEFRPIEPEPTVPKAEPGMPEAGLQRDIFGYEHPVYPKGKGEVTQISMDDAVKLAKAYDDAGLPPPRDVVIKPKIEGVPELSAATSFERITLKVPSELTEAQRKAALKKLKVDVGDLLNTRKARLALVKARKAKEMAMSRQPQIGEGYLMQPFAGGKIYERTFIDSFNRFFGHEGGLPGLTVVADTAGILRITKAALDFSIMSIQGLPAWGIAHAYMVTNPAIGSKLMASWYKAFAMSIEAAFAPETMAKYMTKHQKTVMQRVNMGGSVASVDFFATLEARAGLGGWAEKAMGKIPLRPYHRAEAAFFAGGEVVRDEFWKILSPKAIAQGKEYELARFLDRITGIFDSKAAGVPLSVRQLEQSFVWFAPNYTRACLTVVGDIFRGGYTGSETRKALGGLIAAGASYYTGVQYALATAEGQSHEDAMETVLEGFGVVKDPITGETKWAPTGRFMTIQVGNYRMGVGGFWYGLVRLAGNIMATATEAGDRERVDFVKIIKDGEANRDNPFVYWWYTRSSPIVGTGIELATGKDFLGYPLESPMDYARYVATRFEPIWMEQGINWMIPGMARDHEVPEDKAKYLVPLGELFGLRTFPDSAWTDFYDKASELIKHIERSALDPKQVEAWQRGNLEWRYLTKSQQIQLLSRYPELQELYETAQTDSFVRDSEEWKAWGMRTDEEQTVYYGRGASIVERLKAGDLNTRALREKWGDAGQNYGVALDSIARDPHYQNIYDYFEEKEANGDKYGFMDDLALSEYELLMFSDFTDSHGEPDWDERDRRIDDFIEKWGEDTYLRIRQMYADKKAMAGLDPMLLRLSDDKDKLGRTYWRLPRAPYIELDESEVPAESVALWKQAQGLEDNELEAFLGAHPELNKDWRAEYRKANPEHDAMLSLWGYGGKLHSREAYDLVLKWAGELGIPLAQIGLGLPPESLIDDYFGLNAVVSEHSGNSAEAKLFKLQHPRYLEWGLEQGIWSDDLSDESVEALKLKVEMGTLPEGSVERAQMSKRIEAYENDMPEAMIETYVDWYMVDRSGYEDDWYLLSNGAFYKEMVRSGIWQDRDFSKVPTREVFALYEEYQTLGKGAPRTAFRILHPALDNWFHVTKGYKLLTELIDKAEYLAAEQK